MKTGGIAVSAEARRFDVVCAGQAFFRLAQPEGTTTGALRFRPGGGAVNVALALARRGLRVGLATTLPDDTFGRALLERLGNTGVDVSGVGLALPQASLFVVAGGADQEMVAHREDLPPIVVPPGWSSRLLFLSGLSPVVAHAAAICKAARAGRRHGAIVVLEVDARQHVWRGQDARSMHAALREVDVVRCTTEDLAVLGVDAASLRARLRREAVLVTSMGTQAIAVGPFGEVTTPAETPLAFAPAAAGDTLTITLCQELARTGEPGERDGASWRAILRRGRPAAERGAWVS